jgi:mannose-1-phosphate guanylyltransferase
MQAIVRVGGEGTRLRPLTETVPKPAVPLVDRPLLTYMVEWLARHGVDEVVLACGFMPDKLREALGDGERTGARIRYVAEPSPLGTAGAIRFADDELSGGLGERFVALNGDLLTDLDLTALLEAHGDSGGQATIGLHSVEDSSAYGLVRTDEGGRVLAFEEKTGEKVPGERVSIERDVFPRLAGDGLHALLLDGYWLDVGTPERYLEATWDILEGTVETTVEATGPGIYVGRGAEVAESALVGPRAVIGAGCTLEPGAEVRDSVLLHDCRIGEGARVEGSILAAGVEVAPGASLEGAVIGRDERVPA